MSELPRHTPTRRWRNAKQAGERINKSPRFIVREVRAGRLRAARIGGRGEILTCDEWLDEYVERQAQPVSVVPLKKAS